MVGIATFSTYTCIFWFQMVRFVGTVDIMVSIKYFSHCFLAIKRVGWNVVYNLTPPKVRRDFLWGHKVGEDCFHSKRYQSDQNIQDGELSHLKHLPSL